MNLNDARLFVQAVTHGGFAAAARALGIPKSTLSKRVGELERELGVALIHRSARRFVLTPVGREFHRRAATMAALAEDAEAAVLGQLVEPTGMVRITSSVPTAQTWLADLLPKIAVALPKLRIVHHATDRFVDIASEGFDMAVRAHFGPLADSSLLQRRLGADPFWLVASPRYLTKRGKPKRPEDLATHDALLVSPTTPTLTFRNVNGRSVTVEPQARFYADETQMLLRAARANLGFVLVPRRFCAREVEEGHLRRVLPEWNAGSVTTTILVPERRGDLPAVRAVSDRIAEAFAEQQME